MVPWKQKEAAIRQLEKNGKVDPLDLIEAARKPGHPCHGDFTWDIKAAAAERWRDQARAIIRRCRFEVKVEEVTTPVVKYVATNDEECLFVSLPGIRGKKDVKGMLLYELKALHGIASRVHGMALSKSNIIGPEVATGLDSIRSQLQGLMDGLE